MKTIQAIYLWMLLICSATAAHGASSGHVAIGRVQIGMEVEQLARLGVLAEPCRAVRRMHEHRCRLAIKDVFGVPVSSARALVHLLLVQAVVVDVDASDGVLALRNELTQRYGDPIQPADGVSRWEAGYVTLRLSQLPGANGAQLIMTRQYRVDWER